MHRSPPRASAEITITSTDARTQRTTERRFSLRCGPTGGTIPDAARLCRDVASHPRSMLAPADVRSGCTGRPFGTIISVTARRRGRVTSFGGGPGCDWPGGTALALYWAAARHDTHVLSQMEPRLGCDDDPVLLARPTPWRSVFACTHGLWTTRTASLIRAAEALPRIAALRPASIFPHQIGIRPCRIPAGGPRAHVLAGRCEVDVRSVWASPRVTFTESWRVGMRNARHTWIVGVRHGKPSLVGERGVTPPQEGI